MPSRASTLPTPGLAGARATANQLGRVTSRIDPRQQPANLGQTSRAYSQKAAQEDYAAKALAYQRAMGQKNVADATGPSAPVLNPPTFSATGINVAEPSPAQIADPTVAAAVAPVPKEDPIEEAYNKYKAGLEANRTTNMADSAAIKDAISGYYGKAAEGNLQTIGNSQTAIDEQSKALGIDFAGSREGQLINAGARNRQEQLDSMQAHNLSSVDKMQQLQGGVYDAYGKEGELVKNRSIAERASQEAAKQLQLQQIQADIESAMAQAQSAGSSGGGGGGRRRGGGSGSSSGKTTIGEGAEETSYVNNIGDVEALKGLSPSAAAQFRRIYNLGGGDVTSSLSEGQKLFDAEQARSTPNIFSGQLSRLNKPVATIRNAKKGVNLATIAQAMDALTGISGVLGTPTTRRKVTTTSKKNTKK